MHESVPASRGTILVAADDTAAIATLRTHFVAEGYRVDIALHGGDAVMLASLERPDAVILDLPMVDTSGPDVLAALHANDPTIAVVVLAAADEVEAAQAMVKSGAVECVRKPFKLEQLDGVVRLAVVVGRSRPPRGVVVPFRTERRDGVAPSCPGCRESIVDRNTAVKQRNALFHSRCWLRAQSASS